MLSIDPTPRIPSLTFGLSSAVPPEAKAAWGARLIFRESSRGKFCILYDRQSAVGDKEHKEELGRVLNLKALKEAAEMWQTVSPGESDREEYLLYDDGRVRMKASPNGSYGYIYVAAWIE